MFPFRKLEPPDKLEPPFSWRGHKVKVRIALGDAESFYNGTLENIYSDGLLIRRANAEIFVPQSSVVAIEKEINPRGEAQWSDTI